MSLPSWRSVLSVGTKRTRIGSQSFSLCLSSVHIPPNRARCSVRFDNDYSPSHVKHRELHPLGRIRARCFSTFRGSSDDRKLKIDALPFTVSPDDALEKFRKWAVDEQGLNYLISWNSLRIGAAFCPVWSFTVNVRFVRQDPATGRIRFDWKPDFLSVYGHQDTIHLPGLSSYAGYTYRRSLINPLHNTTLVFLGDQTVPFDKWMLRDMVLSNGERLEIFPDPWNASKGRSLQIIKEELHGLVQGTELHDSVKVEIQLLSARRVYMPTYVIDYKVWGMEYRAFVSGCDLGAAVSGISHKVFELNNRDVTTASQGLLAQALSLATTGARILGSRQLVTFIVVALQFLGSLAARLLIRIPWIGLLGGAVVGFRKIIQPWMDNRWASAEWERQREHEAYSTGEPMDHTDDFVDNGQALRFFRDNRGRILGHLAGEEPRASGEFDWYKEWEQWARQQWERQQEQFYQNQQTYQESSQQQQRSRQKPKPDYKWDFDPNDPYSVLGLKRGASKAEVSAAFRKQMMMHHPDTKAGASEAEKARAVERSKIISDAYRKLKEMVK